MREVRGAHPLHPDEAVGEMDAGERHAGASGWTRAVIHLSRWKGKQSAPGRNGKRICFMMAWTV